MTTSIPAIGIVPRRALAAIVIALGLSGALIAYGRLTAPHQTIVEFHTIPTAGATGYPQPVNLVIEDNDTWAKVWTRAYWEQPYCSQPRPLGGYPCEPAPSINFTTRTVIAVFMGEQPGPLYKIKITQIIQGGSDITVHVLWTKAGSCGETTEGTWPAHIVDIPKTEDRITFTTETVEMQCCTQPSLLGGYPCIQAPLRPSPSGRR